MIELEIPGRGTLQLQHLVMGVNGTLAVDDSLPDGLAKRLMALRDRLELHLVTADTHGRQFEIDRQLSLQAVRIGLAVRTGSAGLNESAQKAEYVRTLGADTVAAVG